MSLRLTLCVLRAALAGALTLVLLTFAVGPSYGQAPVKGGNVTAVDVGPLAGGASIGQLRQVGPATWAEVEPNGKVTHQLEETGRSEWYVFLQDRSRGLKLQIDLYTRKVLMSKDASEMRPMIAIIGVSAAPVLAMAAPQPQVHQQQPPPQQAAQPSADRTAGVTVVSFAQTANAAATGQFRQTGARQWTEFNAAGVATSQFEELSAGANIIVILDRSRDVYLALDLAKARVMYREGPSGQARQIYHIVGTSSAPPIVAQAPQQVPAQQPQPVPPQQAAGTRIPVGVTSRNVVMVRYEGAEFHMVGPNSWVEKSNNGSIGATFVEERRDDGSVYISDPAGSPRGMKLRLDLNQQQVFFSEHGAPMRALYPITGAAAGSLASQQAPAVASVIPSGVTGLNVTTVKFAGAEMRMVGPRRWVEQSNNGTTGATFVEENRSEQSVYLADLPDSLRGMKLLLDLKRQLISFSDPKTPMRPLYPITGAVAAAMPTQQPIAVTIAPLQQETLQAAVPRDPAPDELVIYEDVPDMSQDAIQQVMGWIQNKVTGEKLPFCWRQSYGRGVGTIPGRVADCPPSYTNNGATCGRSADTILAGGSVVADCPAGYTNMGLTCYRPPSTYSKSCTIPFFGPKHACREGYTDNGCFCGRGADSIGWSNFVCPAGYFKSDITQRCHKECPAGYTNTGETCFRGVSTLGMGSMLCKPGEEKIGARCFPVGAESCFNNEEKDAGLCYKRCNAGMTGVGPVCWQDCPSGWANCGAGCAKSSAQCGTTVFDQVLAPLIVAANVATLGLATPATGAAGAAARETLVIGGKTVAGTSKVGQGFVKVIKLLQAVKPEGLAKGASVATRVYAAKTGAYAAKSASKVWAVGNNTRKVVMAVYDANRDYLTAFADDFSAQTSSEINKAIDDHFIPKTARFMKETWARQQLGEMASANGFVIAQDVLGAVSIVDITGVTGVVSAYAKPICQTVIPFPCVDGTINCKR